MTITYKSRDEVPLSEKWNLEDLYVNLQKWEDDLQLIEVLANELKTFDGAINNGNQLLQFLTTQEKLSYKFNHLYAYAMLKVDENTRDTTSQSLLERARALSVKVSSATSFFLPFLLSLEEHTLKKYIAEEQ